MLGEILFQNIIFYKIIEKGIIIKIYSIKLLFKVSVNCRVDITSYTVPTFFNSYPSCDATSSKKINNSSARIKEGSNKALYHSMWLLSRVTNAFL